MLFVELVVDLNLLWSFHEDDYKLREKIVLISYGVERRNL